MTHPSESEVRDVTALYLKPTIQIRHALVFMACFGTACQIARWMELPLDWIAHIVGISTTVIICQFLLYPQGKFLSAGLFGGSLYALLALLSYLDEHDRVYVLYYWPLVFVLGGGLGVALLVTLNLCLGRLEEETRRITTADRALLLQPTRATTHFRVLSVVDSLLLYVCYRAAVQGFQGLLGLGPTEVHCTVLIGWVLYVAIALMTPNSLCGAWILGLVPTMGAIEVVIRTYIDWPAWKVDNWGNVLSTAITIAVTFGAVTLAANMFGLVFAFLLGETFLPLWDRVKHWKRKSSSSTLPDNP